MHRPGSPAFRPAPRNGSKIGFAAAEPRQPARRFALDQRVERLADQRRFLLYSRIELGLCHQIVIEGDGRPHGFSPHLSAPVLSSIDAEFNAGRDSDRSKTRKEKWRAVCLAIECALVWRTGMAAERVGRKLAAILAADVAGYSRLMGADEEGTLARLKALRAELVDPAIAGHNGRIVKTTGDGLLVEFASVVDAMRCAIAWQSAMAARPQPADTRIEWR